MRKANRFLTVLIFAFLYVPMLVLIAGSFNTGKSLSTFEGFTFHQYAELNSEEHYREFAESGFYVHLRHENSTIEETLKMLEEHFLLT